MKKVFKKLIKKSTGIMIVVFLLISTFMSSTEVFARTRPINTVEPSGTLNLEIDSSGVMEWDSVSGATGYTVSLTKPNYTELNNWNANNTAFAIISTIDQLKYDSGQYTICVSANGVTAHQCVIYYYTSNVDQIEAPTNLRWNGNIAEWDAVDGASLYYVSLYDFNSRVTNQSTTNTSFDFSGFSPEDGWTFKVQAAPANSGTLSALRNSKYIESPAKGTSATRTRPINTVEPSGALNLAVDSSGILEWDSVIGATGYTVSLTKPNVTELNNWNSNNSAFAIISSIDQLKYATGQYTICVSANGVNNHQCISYYYTSNVDQMEAPNNLRWNGDIAEWDAVTGAGLYYVDLYDFNGRVIHQSTTDTSFDFSSLSPKDDWTFRVQAAPSNTGTLSALRNSEYIESPAYVEAPTVIDELSATITVPTAGVTPNDLTLTSGDPTAYSVEAFAWFDTHGSIEFTDTFIAGETYQVGIRFTANAGYEIADLATFSINDVVSYSTYNVNEKGMTFIIPAAATHDVTFNLNGGTWTDTGTNVVTVNDDDKVTKPSDPTLDGYVFAGWYADAGFNNVFDFNNTMIGSDTTIYAKWNTPITEASATVTAPVAGATPDFNPVIPDGVNYTVVVETWYLHESPYPELTNESTFVEGKEYSLRVHFIPNEGYSFTTDATFTMNGSEIAKYGSTGDREYSKIATAGTRTVTFNLNDGTWTDTGTNVVTVNDGAKVTRPATNPTKENNLFVDWYADAGFTTPFDFSNTTIDEDTMIYAKWSQYANILVGITPDAGSWDFNISPGGTGPKNSTVLITTLNNNQVNFTATANTGYHFVGWYEGIVNNDTHYVDDHTETLLSADSTYTATITEYNTYVMAVFEANGTVSTTAVYEFEAVSTEDELVASGTDLADYINGKKVSIFENATANAGWLALYREENGEYKYPKETTLTNNMIEFMGQTYEGVGTDHMTVVNHYKVKYTEVTVARREILQFQVWHNEGGATAIQYTIDEPNVNNLQSKEELDFEPAVGMIYYGIEATVTAKPDDGYRFVGWYHVDIDYEPNSQHPLPYMGDVISTDLTYTYQPGVTVLPGDDEELRYICAVFEKTHTVTFVLNGGTWTDERDNPIVVNNGDKVSAPSTPTKSSNTFAGWYADAGFTTPFDFNNTTITSDTNVYAKFLPRRTVITEFIANPYDSEEVSYDTDLETYTASKLWDGGFTGNEELNNTWTSLFGQVDGVWQYPANTGLTYTFVEQEVTETEILNKYRVTYDQVVVTKAANPETKEITDVNLTITLPNVGDTISYNSNTEYQGPQAAITIPTSSHFVLDGSEEYQVNYMNYYVHGTDTLFNDTFVMGMIYDMVIWLVSTDDYHFVDSPTIVINGALATLVQNDDGDAIGIKYSFIPASNLTITGDNQTFTLGDTNDITITCSGALDNLIAIKVNGSILAEENRELVSGSTVLTLKNSYLNTLSEGIYTITFDYGSDSIDATLNVVESTNNNDDNNTNTSDVTNNNTNNPQTSYNVINYIYTLIIGIICLAGGFVYLKRKKLFEK